MSKNKIILGVLLVLLPFAVLVGAAFAEGRSQPVESAGRASAYKVSGVTAAYRTGLTTGDNASAIHADNLALEKVVAGGFTTLAVAGRTSVASATCVVRVVRYTAAGTVAKSTSVATLTGDDTNTDGTKYMAPTLYFDTEGAPVIRVLIETPSSGNVDLWTEVN